MARVSAAEAAKIDKIAVVACIVCPPVRIDDDDQRHLKRRLIN
jgi:orotidine-5'-phosphate decarboxylase